MRYIKKFDEITIDDIAIVGGKNASIGEMIKQLTPKGIRISQGFAITAQAYWYFLERNQLIDEIKMRLQSLSSSLDLKVLKNVSQEIRRLIEHAVIPDELEQEILVSYKNLCRSYKQTDMAVAVRSSATAEDLPTASFAGQQETYLNIRGSTALLHAVKKCMASLFTERAIIYRMEKGFDHLAVALSVGIQKMIRSDKASAGVIFTLDTETGFKDVIIINSSWGLGEALVKGLITPDEFWIYKPTLKQGFAPIIKKRCGDKQKKIVYKRSGGIKEQLIAKKEQNTFSLTDEEILQLANYSLTIEDHYSARKQSWCPMDIEWAKDGIDNQLYIVQARPETVHAVQKNSLSVYILKPDGEPSILAQGQSIGEQIVSGTARVIESINDVNIFNKGDILVTTMTDPDWVPLMKKAGAIVTDSGGRTSHAAIVSRELGIPALVATGNATSIISSNQTITVDCSKGHTGYVYDAAIPFQKESIDATSFTKPPVPLMVNCADPDSAIKSSLLPVDGVGLARIEFIITNTIRIHPMVAVDDNINLIHHKKLRKQIDFLIRPYGDCKTFFIDLLAQGIGMIAAAFYPKPVIVRFSDFKSNEYEQLLGGYLFELKEENPMLGLRGASRYYNKRYQAAFELECAAIKRVRTVMGLDNIKIMIPFVRTIEEAQKVSDLLKNNGIDEALECYMMVEIPSNVILIDEFCKFYDGFSIGSNDLTQMTLAVDRDSAELASLFNERDEAVQTMIRLCIEGSKRNSKPIGICGQAPSDYPAMGLTLIERGISSISLNPDAVIPFLRFYSEHSRG